jgi:hypothetical protein
MAIAATEFGGFDLPWWGVLASISLSFAVLVPFGMLVAISGQMVGVNVAAEFLAGLILPGKFVAVSSFKTISEMALFQGLFMVQDMKLGHYMKIPPRVLFAIQLGSTLMAVIINLFGTFFIYDKIGYKIDGGIGGWNGNYLISEKLMKTKVFTFIFNINRLQVQCIFLNGHTLGGNRTYPFLWC